MSGRSRRSRSPERRHDIGAARCALAAAVAAVMAVSALRAGVQGTAFGGIEAKTLQLAAFGLHLRERFPAGTLVVGFSVGVSTYFSVSLSSTVSGSWIAISPGRHPRTSAAYTLRLRHIDDDTGRRLFGGRLPNKWASFDVWDFERTKG